MIERLPRGYFDKLAESIWTLGKVTMSDMISIAPIPGLVKGAIYVGDTYLEPEYEIRTPMPDALTVMPAVLSLTISDTEPFALNESLTMFSYRRLSLDRNRHKRTYTTGVSIEGDGNQIQPLLSLPEAGKALRPGNKDWGDIMQGNIAEFGKSEADEMMALIDSVVIAQFTE